jgi:hypothetical protein
MRLPFNLNPTLTADRPQHISSYLATSFSTTTTPFLPTPNTAPQTSTR